MSGGQLIGALLILAVSFMLYFLPSIVAGERKHQSWGGIFVVNLFFGWTLLGWVVALAWGLSGVSGKAPHSVVAPAEKACPKCAEQIKASAVICRFCGHDFANPDGPPTWAKPDLMAPLRLANELAAMLLKQFGKLPIGQAGHGPGL